MACPAQEFFRDLGTSRSSGGIGPVVPSEYSYEEASPSGLEPLDPQEPTEENEHYNFAIGPLRFALAAGLGIEWNDNITLSDENRQSDLIIRPSLNLEATWRVSDLNTLRFSLGASYAKYLDHSEYDTRGILLSPTSELALTFFLGEVKFTVRDRFSYQEDPYDVPVISDVAQYRRWENQAGIQADWQVNDKLAVTAGYDHYNLWSVDDFEDQDRAVDTVFIRPSYALTPSLSVGINATYSFITFESSDRDKGHNVLVGPFAKYQLSEHTNFYLEAGLQRATFDGEATVDQDVLDAYFDEFVDEDISREAVRDSLRDDDNETSSYYVRFEINNEPTEFFKHRLSGSKTAEVGFFSNYYDLYHVEYNADWKIRENTSFDPTLFYEYYETSGNIGEKAHRWGAALGLRHNLTNSVTLGLDYRFLLKDSNLASSDYRQNLVFLSVYYKF